MTDSGTSAGLSGERADLVADLAKHRGLLRKTVQGITEEQARQRTTVSELSLGGLIKHVASIEEGWMRFAVDGPSALRYDLPDGVTWADLTAGTAREFPQFMSGVRAVRQIDDRRTHWVTEIGGVTREFDAEIVEQRPDERIAWQSTDGDTRHAGVVTFQPLAAGRTRVTVAISWEPHGLVEKAGSALGVDEYQVRVDAERFKEFVEQRAARPNATA